MLISSMFVSNEYLKGFPRNLCFNNACMNDYSKSFNNIIYAARTNATPKYTTFTRQT